MDKRRYNFNTQPKKLSDSQIKGHMDFDALLSKHQSTATRKSGGGIVRILAWLAPAAAAAVLLFLFLPDALKKNNYPDAEQAFFIEQPYVNPPIPEALAAFASKKVDAYNGGTYEYETGSKVIIPKAAFVSETGEVIGGEVELRYREYQDFVDFFLSGIPMHYDSLGQRYQLESAGMVEFYAEQNGKRVNVAPGKSIEVELPGAVYVRANDPVPNFNIYKLEVGKRNWAYHGPNDMSFTDKLKRKDNSLLAKRNRLLSQQKQAIGAVESSNPLPVAPLPPRRKDPNDRTISFSFNDLEAGYDGNKKELRAQYETSIWQEAKGQNYDSALAFGIDWEDLKLEKINDQLFLLTLLDGEKSLEIKVHPVLTGERLLAAQNEYKRKLSDYELRLAETEEKIEQEKESISRRYAQQIAELEQTESAKTEEDEKIRRKVISRFVATDFGIWNVDRPLNPHPIQVNGTFKNEQNDKITNQVAYIADTDRNTLSRLLTTNRSPVGFNKSAKTFMWVVTEDKKIAVYRPENFAQIKNEDDSYTFVLKESDKKIETESELRSILSL